jgi:alkaline phosphatase D
MQVIYQKASTEENVPPSSGMRFLGQLDIDAETKAMTVMPKDLTNVALNVKTMGSRST